jgi:hypothetical protein
MKSYHTDADMQEVLLMLQEALEQYGMNNSQHGQQLA